MERFGPTLRGGPIFRWLGEPLAIDLANTVMVVREDQAVDLLETSEDLRRWLDAERPRLGDCAFALPHLEEVRALRDSVRGLLLSTARGVAPQADALEAVNAANREAPAAAQIEAAADGELRLVELRTDGEPIVRLLGTLAGATIALLTGPERPRLRVCEAPSCGMLFLGARRWCCAACGNRARAARHYRRRTSASAGPRAAPPRRARRRRSP